MQLSRTELALWHAWKRAHAMVMSRIERELQADAGLSGADFGVLSRLVDLGNGELRQQALADAMQWDKSRLSHHLSRMSARGLLTRIRTAPKLVHVRISRRGRTALATGRRVHARAVRMHLLDRIERDLRAELTGVLAALAQ